MTQKGSGENRADTGLQGEFKVVIVGDSACGKSSLLHVYTSGVFPQAYIPSVSDQSIANLSYGGQHFRLHLYDTAGLEGYDRVRPLSYQDVDVVLICYDVMSPSSFENVFEKWFPEVQKFCEGVPIILVGCKADLRKDEVLMKQLLSWGQNAITNIQGEEAREKLKAVLYMECSAKDGENVDDLFKEVTRQAQMAPRERKKVRKCDNSCALL